MQHIEHNQIDRTVHYQDDTGEHLTWQQVEEDIAEYLETKVPGATITQVAPADGPGWWYAEYEGEHMQTTIETPAPLQRLETFYAIAAATGQATGDLQYLELLDDLHLSIRAIAMGDDPTRTLQDQANEWRVDATMCASEATASRFRAWATMLQETI